jgi:hypothetical protein
MLFWKDILLYVMFGGIKSYCIDAAEMSDSDVEKNHHFTVESLYYILSYAMEKESCYASNGFDCGRPNIIYLFGSGLKYYQ